VEEGAMDGKATKRPSDTKERRRAEESECRGKVEIRKQDSHFATAPIACGARKKNLEIEG
jgi:hypothetical protein